MQYALLGAAFILNAVANIFLKQGAEKGIVLTTLHPYALVLQHWEFLLGILCFGLNALLYFFALRTIPLSVAYPVMVGMSFAIIGSYAIFILGETVTVHDVLGYLLIFAGVLLVVSRM